MTAFSKSNRAQKPQIKFRCACWLCGDTRMDCTPSLAECRLADGGFRVLGVNIAALGAALNGQGVGELPKMGLAA